MGWFSADEVIAVANTTSHDTIQTVSIAALALLAMAYGLFKWCNMHNRHQAEQVADRAVRFHAAQP